MEMLNDILKWLDTNSPTLVVVGIIGLACVFAMPRHDWGWYNVVPRMRGRKMRKKREEHVESEATYAFVSFVEDQVRLESFTRKEASELYRKLKKSFPIRDLFPSVDKLKETCRRRIALLKEAPTIPVSKREEKPKAKHMFDKSTKA